MERLTAAVFLLIPLTSNWFIEHFRPEQNIEGWLAALGGSLIMRVLPVLAGLPLSGSFFAFIGPALLAAMLGPEVAKSGGLQLYPTSIILHSIVSINVILALLIDGILRIVFFIYGFGGKVGDSAIADPGKGMKDLFSNFNQLADLLLKIRSLIDDLFTQIKGLFTKK